MNGNQINIQMRLLSVNEVSYKIQLNKLDNKINPEDMEIGFSNQVMPDMENNILNIEFAVKYTYDGEAVLESIYRFSYSVTNLQQFITINENKSITIAHIMPKLLSVTLDTMRGILLVKTAGTVFSKFLVPMIDVNMLNNSHQKRSDAQNN